jgi:putative FmdB family regulatory protein
MPFYEYECSACKFYVEALQKVSDEPLRKCPSCKKQTLKRLISAPVFRLKGGGWYETDFKSDNEQKRNIHGREEAEAKADDAKTAKPAEDKSAGPAEAGTAAKSEKAAQAKSAPARAKPAKVAASRHGHKKSKSVAKSPARRKAARR